MNKISLVLFVVGLNSAFALRCYFHVESTSQYDVGQMTQCGFAEDRCIKMEKTYGNDRPLVSRACGQNSRNSCDQSTDQSGARVNTCYCDHDGCNSAESAGLAFTTALAAIVAKYVVA